MKKKTTYILTALTIVCASLGGCVSVPDDLWRSEVDARLEERRIGVTPDGGALDVDALTARPLTASTAAALALAASPTAARHYARLGITAADLIDHASIGAPGLSVSSLDSNLPDTRSNLVYGIAASLSDIVTFRGRRDSALSASEAERLQITVDLASFASDVQAGFYMYQTALALAEVDARKATLAVLSADLAARFHAAGNLTEGQRLDAVGDAAAVRADALSSRSEARLARAQLAGLLGLPLDADWSISTGIEVPAGSLGNAAALLTTAMASRIDLAALEAETTSRSEHSGFDPTQVLLGDAQIGILREFGQDGDEELVGPTFSWSPPLFGGRRAETMRDAANLADALARTDQLRTDIRNAVLAASAALEDTAAAAAFVRDTVIPARRQAVARAQEQLNFMLVGVFDVFEHKQREYDAYRQYFAILGERNQARVALTRAVGRDLATDGDKVNIVSVEALLGASDDGVKLFDDMHDMHNMPNKQDGGAGEPDPHRDHGGEQPAESHEHHGGKP